MPFGATKRNDRYCDGCDKDKATEKPNARRVGVGNGMEGARLGPWELWRAIAIVPITSEEELPEKLKCVGDAMAH